MKYFTKTQLNKLEKFEKHFSTVTYQFYKRPTSASLNDELADIMDKHTGTTHQRQWGCGSCVFRLYKEAAKYYYASLEKIKDNESEEQAADPEKPKRGRPKKSV